ncbi:glycosyltransferase [Azoarcus olearius]|nr:glycosyltransferase [Azoarcus olearius]
MRVVHVYRTYFPDPPGGLQEAVRQICIAVGNAGAENRIFTLSPRPDPARLARPEGEVVRARSWAAPASCDLGGPSALAAFRDCVAWADVVHVHFPWPYADVLCALSGGRRPLVVTYHSDIVRQRLLGKLYRPLMMRTLRRAAAVVATSPAYALTSPVLQVAGIRDKVEVIPLGIDENSYPTNRDESVLARLGLVVGQPFFLFIGVLRYYKGLHTLLSAAAEVDAPIVIAGCGPQDEWLRAQIATEGLANVRLAGLVSETEKMALLAHCSALVLPSHLRSEAFGMVLVEAAMHGKPMISCELGTGTSFVNLEGDTGFVVPPEQPAALAAAMRRLLADPELRAGMGAAARVRYEQRFSGGALGRSYAALFERVARTGGT